SDDDAEVRRHAALALGAIGEARAAPPLAAAFVDADAAMRQAIARSLGALRDARSAPTLLTTLRSEEPEVADSVADALIAMGPPAARACREALSDPRPIVRTTASRALA